MDHICATQNKKEKIFHCIHQTPYTHVQYTHIGVKFTNHFAYILEINQLYQLRDKEEKKLILKKSSVLKSQFIS